MLTAPSQDILDLITTVMMECDTMDYSTYYNMLIASNIFYFLGTWGLFFVVVYQLNTMIRTQLGGLNAVFKVVPATWAYPVIISGRKPTPATAGAAHGSMGLK
jgi:hypothetical protein